MNNYKVTAPSADFNGESAGVVFHKGAGHVDDSTKEGRAAIEYFRRRGYTLARKGGEEQDDGQKEPDADSPDGPFDPATHSAEQVLAYLDSTTDEDEILRVLAAEEAGKARKTILARGES